MKTFKGKAIYNPSGKAGEYSYWACNFYVGCSNGCEYCYCKKGLLKSAMGQDKPQLKKFFKDENHAFIIFSIELMQNLEELKKHGIFFSFSTDPCLPETWDITWKAVLQCVKLDVPVKILTKCVDWIDDGFEALERFKEQIAIGFTLTGHDELEPGAPHNLERILAMHRVHNYGYKTWASIEPIFSFQSSLQMIEFTKEHCDLYKIGLLSGQKIDRSFKSDLIGFYYMVMGMAEMYSFKVYWKDSIRKYVPAIDFTSVVGRDYNMFKH